MAHMESALNMSNVSSLFGGKATQMEAPAENSRLEGTTAGSMKRPPLQGSARENWETKKNNYEGKNTIQAR